MSQVQLINIMGKLCAPLKAPTYHSIRAVLMSKKNKRFINYLWQEHNFDAPLTAST
jgi:hypothetical protein